ncbi:endolytic transglycosylase MltG [Caproiciproducens sp. NJN-50]|uniref:endolytic transglycosylase MltG n=1 Tax=Caproiciproducens sp. NJN-50 TaxID=2507162 RepID=UPI000FFE02DF|nr:endolytic transglycosylase MltG [Caproiciproducens sp. NJN-50]QAT50647.1 endolytic transglycosylase MltG [Caproiciproducens sp. NJN-50]
MLRKRICPFLLAALFGLLTACSSGQGSSSAPVSSEGDKASSSSSSVSSSDSAPASSSSSGAASKSAASSSAAKTSSASPAQEKSKTVKVTVPEGFTLPQIAARLEAKGVCRADDFIKAAQTYDFSYYSLVAKIPNSPNRCYKLEGYLYPDTYEFYTDMKPQDAVGKFLRSAESQIGSKYSYSGMTTDQLITLASIIEREADDSDNMKKVSSVFHNRLKTGMILQADSTRDYCNLYLVPKFGDKYNKYYNTYPNRSPGLPIGPISNPGANALYAAAHPADTDYLYFATGTDHNYYYGATQQDRDTLMANAGVTPLYAD